MTRPVAVAAAALAISAGVALAQTGGYVYADPLPRWTARPSPAGSSSAASKQDLEPTPAANGSTGIYVARSYSTGIWLFPPYQLGGGNN